MGLTDMITEATTAIGTARTAGWTQDGTASDATGLYKTMDDEDPALTSDGNGAYVVATASLEGVAVDAF